MQTSCQAISCSVAKLSTDMSRLNKTCSARRPHQVVQMSWPLWIWCACRANNILLNAVIVKASRHMTHQRPKLSASPMTMLSLLMEKKPLKLLKNILEHSVLLLYNGYKDTSAKNPLTASFVVKYSTTFFCITCFLLLHNALDIQDSSLLRT